MPRPSKKTPTMVARMTAMYRADASAREMAEALGVSHAAICRWLREAGLQPKGGAGAREKRPRKPTDAAAVAEAAEKVIVAPPVKGAGGIGPMKAQLATIQSLLAGALPHLQSGAFSSQTFAALTRIQTQMLTDLAALEPPPPVDPERDPVNLELAALVERKLRTLVEDAEARAAKKGTGGR